MPPSGVDAGTIYSEIRIKLDKLSGDVRSVSSEFDKLEKGTNQTEKAVTQGFEKINLAGVAAFAAISAGIKVSIDAFSKFEDEMAQVHTTMNGTEQDFINAENATIKLGSSTDFTTKQIAGAMKVFNKFGDDVSTSMELLSKSMTLAQAKSKDLTFTADLLRTTLSQFGLATDQADRLINVFAASKVPLEDIKTTLQTIGPTVAGMGISIEEVVATIKLLGQAGIDGGTAGSSLRLVLSDLGDTTSAMSKKLQQYGVDLTKINPQTHSFAQIIGELEKAGLGASDVMSIFGARAGNAMVTLLGKGQDALEDYTKSITGTDEAVRQSEIMENTLADATKTMSNAFEIAGVSLVKEFAPAIRFLVDIVTKGLQLFLDLPGPVKLFLGVCAVGIPVVMGLSAAFGVLASLVTASALPIVAIVAGIGAVVAIGATLAGQLKDNSKEWKNQKDWIDQNTKSVEDYKKAIIIDPNAGKRSISELKKGINEIDTEIKKLRASLKNVGTEKPGTMPLFIVGDKNDAAIAKAKKDADDTIAINNKINQLIAVQETLRKELTEAEKKQGEQTKVLTEEQKKEVERLADINREALKNAQSYIQKIEDQQASEEYGIELERNRALAEVKASEASAEAKNKEIEAINFYYDLLRDDGALKKRIDDEKKAADEIEDRNKKLQASIENFIGGIAGAFQGLFSAIYDQRLKDLDTQMKAEIEAAGVAEDTAVQKAQKELDAARAGGDAVLIMEKEKVLKRAQIEADYEKKKAQLSYEAAHLQWQLTLANAWAQAAMAQFTAWNSLSWPWNLVPMGLAAVMSGVQIAAVTAAEPKPPTFETGGIVPGNRFSGDHINARLNSGEMVITKADQAALFAFIKNGSRGGRGDININNDWGGVYSETDTDRVSRKMAHDVAAALRAS